MTIELHCGDCLNIMANMEDNSIDLIVTDPPYFKVKNEWWDRQWDKPSEFLEWIDELCKEWQRILKPNGSLYVFASPQQARGVANVIEKYFCVLNEIRWYKDAGWHKKAKVDELRTYLEPWESIVFAEHYGADNIAKGEAGYVAKCDELRGFVFEPLRAYLAGERDRAGFTTQDVAEAWRIKTGNTNRTGMAGHWFSQVQWTLPTNENYQWLRSVFNRNGDEYLRTEYEELRTEYEELRTEYEELRRPFFATADRPYTDVWTFQTVSHFPGKHSAEKPVELIEHIIQTSSREGATVFDGFMGRGTTAVACKNLGRNFIGCDIMEKWVDATRQRIAEAQAQPMLFSNENPRG